MKDEDSGVIYIAGSREAGGGDTATLLLSPFLYFFPVSAIDVNHSVQARETLMREMCVINRERHFGQCIFDGEPKTESWLKRNGEPKHINQLPNSFTLQTKKFKRGARLF